MKRNFFILIAALYILPACNTQPKEQAGTPESADTNKVSAANPVTQPPATKNTLPFVYGIDISKYQGDEIDFIKKKGDTLTFIICKATEGVTSLDPDFKNNWKAIDEKGFTRGAYHFYHCNDDPIKQATHFVSNVGSFDAEDFPPIVDFEEASVSSSCARSSITSNLLAFLKAVEQQTGRKPLIYTDNNTGGQYLDNAAFADYALFIADYKRTGPPSLPGVWKNKQWALWQKSESYEVDAIVTDFDMFNGGPDEFKKFIMQSAGK